MQDLADKKFSWLYGNQFKEPYETYPRPDEELLSYFDYDWVRDLEGVNLSLEDNHIPNTSLPNKITLTGGCRNVKNGKLMVLCDIYNEAAKYINTGVEFDCDKLFTYVKDKNQGAFEYAYNADEGMQTHRTPFYRMFGKLLTFFFPTESAKFLQQYGFFDAKQTEDINQAQTFESKKP